MKNGMKRVGLVIIASMFFMAAIQSKKTYDVDLEATKIVWKGEKVVGSGHDGTIDLKSGSLIINGDDLVGGEFVVDMNSMVCTDLNEEKGEKLVNHLKSDDFFSVDKYPTAVFKITSVDKQSKGDYNVKGNLTIKGKTEKITFPTKVTKDGSKYLAESTIVFDRSKFDVKYGSGSFFDSLGDKAISDDITIIVNLVTK